MESYGQDLKNFILHDIYFDSAQFVQKKIKSAHIYSERMSQKRSKEPRIDVKKTAEFEFNEFGQVVYKRNSEFKPVRDALGYAKTYYRKYEYDKGHRISKECHAGVEDETCYEDTYNEKGQILKRTNSFGHYQVNEYDYTWEGDSVIDVKVTEKNIWNRAEQPQVKFDSQGTITEYHFEKSVIKLNQKIKGNFKTRTWLRYRGDTLIQQSKTIVLIDKNVLLFHCRINMDGDTIESLEGNYDAQGNLTFLKIREWQTSFKDDVDASLERQNESTYIVESIFKFDNHYSDDLLEKRFLEFSKYEISKGETTRTRYAMKTQRFQYDTDILSEKYWPEKEDIEDEYDTDSPQKIEVIDDVDAPPAPEVLPVKEEIEEIDD